MLCDKCQLMMYVKEQKKDTKIYKCPQCGCEVEYPIKYANDKIQNGKDKTGVQ